MKKAKEYAKQFNDSEDKEAELIKILQEFLDEGQQLKEMRHVSTDAGFVAILREMNEKWNAFARRVDGINQNGFAKFVINRIPALTQYGL